MSDAVRKLFRAVLPGLALACAAGPALAATYVVDTVLDDAGLTACTGAAADCSLRGAILNANSAGGSNTINFDSGYFGTAQTINLNANLPPITGTLVINGPGEALLTVDGGAAHRPFYINAGAQVTLDGLSIAHGYSASNGAGILNDGGSLVLGNATISDSSTDANGGAIYATSGTLTLTACTLSGNEAGSGNSDKGGALYLYGVTTTITDCTLSDNVAPRGAAIVEVGGTLTVTQSILVGNSATNEGGGIYQQGGSSELIDTTVAGNHASNGSGGGIEIIDGELSLNGTLFTDNFAARGGGVYSQSSSSNAVRAINSTFAGNHASNGGGGMLFLNPNGSATVINSTLYGNSSTDYAAGIQSVGSVSLENTIVAGNAGARDCLGSDVTAHHSLIEDGSCAVTAGADGNLTGDPRLDALADNGGPTQTMALLSGSPAVDAGDDSVCSDTTTVNNIDQRGITRPQGAHCDMGAYELTANQDGPHFIVNASADTDDGGCDTLGQGSGHLDCTLREAINAANAFGSASTISFDANVFTSAQTITLTSALPPIANTVTIDGPGADLLTIDGDQAYRPFYVGTRGALSVSGLTLARGRQSKGGAIYSNGTLAVRRVAFVTNVATNTEGGGLYLNNGNATVSASTFSGNTANGQGGAIHNHGATLMVINSSFTGNSALYPTASYGGAVYTAPGGTTTLINSTADGNAAASGGNLYSNGTLTVHNSIVADATTGGDCVAPAGATISVHNSLIEDGSCGITNGIDGNLNGDPMLAALADNGGPTRTLALQAGSPAIDAGDNALALDENANPLSTDQRGSGYPRMVGDAVDLGAFEYSDTAPPVLLSFTRQNPLAANTNADTLTIRASFSEAVQNVDVGDFAVDGTTTAGVSGVSAVDAATYDITLAGGDLAGFNGTVGLDLASGQDITDLAGNALPAGEPATDESWTVDNVPPAVPSKPDLVAAWDTGVSSDDNVTKMSTPGFSGTAEVGVTIVLHSDIDGVLGSGIVPGNGNWYAAAANPMSEGEHVITATAKDAAGNESAASSALSVTIDTTPPVASIFSDYSGSVNASFYVTIDFGESIFGFSDADITVSNAHINPFNVNTKRFGRRVTPTGPDPSTIQFAIAPGSVTDKAGNANVWGPYFSVNYDTSVAGPMCYVNQIATGTGSGALWVNAYTDLQSALTNPRCGEVWAAMGVYKPTSGNASSVSFKLRSGVRVYGGFAGTESERVQRAPDANPTILSGDIGTPEDSNHSWHVVDVSGADGDTVLDGFTITGGQATDQAPPDDAGGGILNEGGSPYLHNLVIEGNSATFGGGMANSSGAAPVIEDVTFSGNSAVVGGGLINSGALLALLNVTISGNQASGGGGGGLAQAGTAYVNNTTISGNSADHGGGIYAGSGTSLTMSNSIVWGNSASTSADEIENLEPSGATISYSIVQGSGGSASWDTGIGQDGGGNLDADPLLGPLADNGGATPTLAIAPGSAAIDSGDDGSCEETDQRGVVRPQGAHCDIGAYELRDEIFADGFEGTP